MTTHLNGSTKLFNIIKAHYGKISVLSYLAAFIVFGFFISEQFCDKTYFSDNALLPGFVKREFDSKQQIMDYLNELKMMKLDKSNKFSNLSSSDMPVNWLTDKFQSLGLQVYTQQFNLTYPFKRQFNLTGTNVYAIFKSTRSLGTETLVLLSPFRNNEKSTLPGISLLISLAKYFSSKNYWSKDLIFLIYEHELVGCEAWLSAYYDLNEKSENLIQFEQLDERSGIIQAAINLELSTVQTSYLDIKIEGLNGQLTNLDLFNVVVEIASRESIDATFHQISHLFSSNRFEVWIEYLKSIGLMIQSQASTFTNGAHGLFQKRSIQSLTLVTGEESSDQDYLKADLVQIGKVIEGVFRSCNNLIERFNRSYWFYLLPSTRRYLSIGFYMVPLALIVLPSLLKALVIYLQTIDYHKSVTKTFWLVLPQFLWIHFYGIVLASFPFIIRNSSKLQSHFNFKSEELFFYSLLSFISSLMFSSMTNQNIKSSEIDFKNQNTNQTNSIDNQISRKLKIVSIQQYIALLELALLITCLSLINISLAFFLAAVYIPIMCSISTNLEKNRTNSQKFINYLLKLSLILVNPLSLIYLCELVNSIYTKPDRSLFVHLSNSFIAQKQFILFLVQDWYLFGNWTYLIGSLAIFPLWLQFWYLN